MDPSSGKESAAARIALLDLLKKNGRTWHDLQKIMADIEAKKESTTARLLGPLLWHSVQTDSTKTRTPRC
jgi:hypothetical protein